MAGDEAGTEPDATGHAQIALIAAARHGDRHAFERLVDAGLPRLIAAARAAGRDPQMALDIAAEALVRAWRDLPALREPADFEQWLDGICERLLAARADEVPASGASDARQVRFVVLRRVRAMPQRGRIERGLDAARAPAAWRPRRSGRLSWPRAAAIAAAGLVVVAVAAVALGPQAPRLSAPSPAAPSAGAAGAPSQPLSASAPPMRSIAVARGGDIWLVRGDAAPVRIVHVDSLTFSGPMWSPTGTVLAFTSDEPAVFVLDLEAATLRRLATGVAEAFSPDGRLLAATQPFRIIDVATGDASPPVSENDLAVESGTLAWAPTGDWIAAAGYARVSRASGTASTGPALGLIRINVATREVIELAGSPVGDVGRPAWSPSATRIAVNLRGGCSGGAACGARIVVMDASGANAAELVRPPGPVGRPAWSPDGAWIAFYQGDDDAVAPGAIVAVRADGSEQRIVSTGGSDSVAWDPAGGSILYSGPSEAPAAAECPPSGFGATNGDLWVAAFPSGPIEKLVDGVDLVVPWCSFDQNPHLPVTSVAVATTSMPLSPLGRGGAWGPPLTAVPATRPAEAAAGTPVILGERSGSIAVDSDCSPRLLVLDRDPALVTMDVPNTIDGGCAGIGWSPADSAYFAMVGGALWRLGRDGSRLISDQIGREGFGSASPRGTFVALLTCLASRSPCPEWQTTIVGARDGAIRSAISGWPIWSPDERRVAVPADEQLSVGNGDGSGMVRVGSFPSLISWAPDASRFAFIRGGNVWTASWDGSDVRPLSDFAYAAATYVSWSPRGDSLLVVDRAGPAWLLSSDGTPRLRIVPRVPTEFSAVAWSPSGQRVALSGHQADGQDAITLISVDSGTAVTLTDASNPVWSPDSQLVAVVDPSETPGLRIDVARADGSGRRTVASTTNGFLEAWLPPD